VERGVVMDGEVVMASGSASKGGKKQGTTSGKDAKTKGGQEKTGPGQDAGGDAP